MYLLRMLVFWFEYWVVILYKWVKKASTVVYINKPLLERKRHISMAQLHGTYG